MEDAARRTDVAGDPLATLPAPHGSGAFSVAPTRGDHELQDDRRAVRRLFLLGCTVWPAFFLVDLLGGLAYGGDLHIAWLATWRLLGAAVGLVAYVVLKRVELSRRALALVNAATFAFGTILLTLISVPFGGLTSRFTQGVLVFVFVRAALLPSRWRRAACVSLTSALMMPLTFGAAALFDEGVRAQWTSGPALLVFAFNGAFISSGVIIGSIGSHLVWMARRQVYEARRLGCYRIKAHIGTGSVADVWLAWQNPPGREVALKILKEPAAHDEEAVRRFAREARAVTRLVNPHTVRVLDFGASDDGVRYIAMEVLFGLDLRAITTRFGPLPASRAILLARHACSSLGEAHAAGIIHRDVKPANLFVSQDDEGGDLLKVLDFGLARALGTASLPTPTPITPEGVLCGTPAYLAPEAIGEEHIDGRVDIYSLGAALYFMVTGTVVFPHLTVSETLMAQIGRQPEAPSSRRPGVPADLERVILRCLAKRPADRYVNAAALDAALSQCADAGEWTPEDARAFWLRLGAHGLPRSVDPK